MANLAFKVHDAAAALLAASGVTMGLMTALPNGDGTGVLEPSAGLGYIRQPLNFAATQRVGARTVLTNSVPLVYGPALTAAWPSLAYFGVFDATGALLCYGPLPSTRAPPVGDSVSFGVGAVQIRLN